jgi:hypothetical protein
VPTPSPLESEERRRAARERGLTIAKLYELEDWKVFQAVLEREIEILKGQLLDRSQSELDRHYTIGQIDELGWILRLPAMMAEKARMEEKLAEQRTKA